uniref:Enoyl-CoA hydratase domain-containing protein 3, mitochondrial n=1 Tax=Odontella aurita TaxID=265563 RepID=A0A7S4J130_9STRA|mmetsp:Transcript_35403/g.105745  ORF Transcript_35403/g.105745 Transcript_35403/m.105745 type:complete len:272 (+) Transcript_35403:110-925(+)
MNLTRSSPTLLKCFTRSKTGVRIIELADPSNRNALSTSMLAELRHAIHEAESDSSIGAVVVQGRGPAFSSGHDLKEIILYQQESDNGDGKKKLGELFGLCSEVMTAVATSPLPFIAKVNGVASAAGCQLVASCDLAYASLDSRASFVLPGVNLGFFCSTPAVAVGRSVPSQKHVMEMLLTGEPITPKRAEQIGLINRAVPKDDLDRIVDHVAVTIASKPRSVVSEGKQLFARQMEEPLDIAYDMASYSMVECAQSEEGMHGIASFFSRRNK